VSRWDDLLHEMRGAGIDEGTLDRLLQGRILPDDAPPGYSDVASILVAAASPPSPEELRMQALHVMAAHDAIDRRTRRFRPGTLGLAAGLLLLGALVLIPGLAVARVLPDPAQHAVTTVLERVGISIPTSTNHPTPVPTPAASPSAGGHPASTGSEISSIATTTDATGVAKGAEISSLASHGTSQAGQHGQASTAPHGKAPSAPGEAGSSSGHGPTGNGAEHASARAAGGSAHP
jgi:hypothetical protein